VGMTAPALRAADLGEGALGSTNILPLLSILCSGADRTAPRYPLDRPAELVVGFLQVSVGHHRRIFQ